MHDIADNLCLHCETGRQSYILDKHSAVCPFLNCYGKGQCTMFSELKTDSAEGADSKIRRRIFQKQN